MEQLEIFEPNENESPELTGRVKREVMEAMAQLLLFVTQAHERSDEEADEDE